MGYYDDTEIGKLNKKAPAPVEMQKQDKENRERRNFAIMGTLSVMAAFAFLFGLLWFSDWLDHFANGFFK
jgi:hypothetical protein